MEPDQRRDTIMRIFFTAEVTLSKDSKVINKRFQGSHEAVNHWISEATEVTPSE